MDDDNDTFSFDNEITGVLKNIKRSGRPKASNKKKKHIACYLTGDEYTEVINFLDGRPASGYIRKLLLDVVRKE